MDQNANVPTFFSTRQAAHLSGMSRTTLDYLVRTELVLPSLAENGLKRGRARKYSFGDIVLLRAIAQLVGMGVSISKLRHALNQLFTTHHEITPGTIPGRYLVTDGNSVYFRTEKHAIESLNEGGQLAFTFILEVQSYRDQILEEVMRPEFKKVG